jgi:hypothetical protein
LPECQIPGAREYNTGVPHSVNPVSELLLELYGRDSGSHARIAPGVAALPFNLPVIIAAEVEISA